MTGKRRISLAVAVVLVVAALAAWLLRSGDGNPKLQFETSKVERARSSPR